MRTVDLRGGSLKALLIFLLVAANILAALPREKARMHQTQALRATPDAPRAERVLPDKQPH